MDIFASPAVRCAGSPSCSRDSVRPGARCRNSTALSGGHRRPGGLASPHPLPHARLAGARAGTSYADASHSLYYYEGPIAGAKKLKSLAKKMKRNANALQALSTQLTEVASGVPVTTSSGPSGASELLPQLQAMQREFLLLCDAAISELDSSSSSSSSDSDCRLVLKARRRASSVSLSQPLAPGQPTLRPTAADRPFASSSGRSPQVYPGSGVVTVCQGGACRKRGADALLQAFAEAALDSPTVEVAGCKCLGRCKAGAMVRLDADGAEAGALHHACTTAQVPDLLDAYFGPKHAADGPLDADCCPAQPAVAGLK